MPKLHLKRTPEEEAAHQVRKQQKNGARRKRRHHNIDHSDGDFPSSSSSKRHRTREDGYPMKWASSDEDEQETEYGPQPPPTTPDSTKFRSHNVDYEQIRAEVEERRFREKMFDALGDDERLDTVEARLNDFAHVPGRWRRVGGKQSGGAWDDDGLGGIDQGNDSLSLDPRYMDDEEYAEWIRAGMYRYVNRRPFLLLWLTFKVGKLMRTSMQSSNGERVSMLHGVPKRQPVNRKQYGWRKLLK